MYLDRQRWGEVRNFVQLVYWQDLTQEALNALEDQGGLITLEQIARRSANRENQINPWKSQYNKDNQHND